MAIATSTLFKIAACGGVIAFGGAAYFRHRIREKFIHTGFYEESVHILNNYPVGVEILGKPIHCKGVDMGDRPNNHSDGHNAKVTIPLSGAKEKGTLQCWCSRDEAQNKWFADKCDLEIRGKKWTFYINPKSEKFSASEHEDKWDEHEEI